MSDFTHLDDKGRPAMVDVGSKDISLRKAKARAQIKLPLEVLSQFSNDELQTKKGPVFQTAVLAGIMGSKKTSDLIPLCHPLALNKCDVNISLIDDLVNVECEVSCNGKTGVEMEALMGANIAALTIYDMCKAFSHDIRIESLELVSKSGGKRDFQRS